MNRTVLSYIVGVAMVFLFIYGIIRFPDGPIRTAVNNSYVGKQGQPHTFAEYHAFIIWQNIFFYVWPIGMIILFLLRKKKK